MADGVDLIHSVVNNTNGKQLLGNSSMNKIGGALLGGIDLASSLGSQYNAINEADDYIGQLQGKALYPNTGYGLQESKDALLSYNPTKYANMKDFGYNSNAVGFNYLRGATDGFSIGNSLGGGALGGIGAALGFIGAGVMDHLSRKKATEELNKYNAEVAKLNAYNYGVLDSNLKNTKNDRLYNSIYNSMSKGGPLETHGSNWSTGLNYIGAGGSHEQNPNGGIQQGIAPDGLPNLVEEGEVIWNGDYVFSKRLKVPKATRNKYKLRGTKPMSFADAALEFNKEMEERPNDPISKRGRDGMLAKLADVQEEKRAKIAAKEQAQQAAMMGMMGMPQDQMAMEEQPMQDDIMSEANQEELARQEIMQGMQQPMVGEYAAKGGPIGHKFANAGAKPNVSDEVANWWRHIYGDDSPLSRRDILQWLKDIGLTEPNKLKNFENVEEMLAFANSGKPKEVANFLNEGYKKRNERIPLRTTVGISDPEIVFGGPQGTWGPKIQYVNYREIPRIPKLDLVKPLDWNDLTTYRHDLASIPQRWRDEQGNILYDKNGNVKTVPNQYEQIKTSPAQERYEFNKETGKLGYVPPTTAQRFGLQTPQLELSPEIRDYGIRSLINSGNGQLLIDAQKENPIVANVPETISDVTDPAGGKGGTKSNYPWQGYLRYAPAIGSGLAVLSDLFGLTNKPDYTAADALANAARSIRNVSFTPIGDYARYKPVDRMMALNQLNAAAGATRRALTNQAAGNRGTAMAGILAADNNYMNNIGNALFAAENANYDRYLKTLEHNAGINKYNSEGVLKAAMANQGADEARARYIGLSADARTKALQYASAARNANLTNLFDNLGNIGIDALNRADARWLAQYWPGANIPSAKHGGRINKRRRRRVI